MFLKKDKTGILLSPAGEKLYEEGKRILGDFDNLIEEVINLSKGGDQCSLNYGMHIVEDALWLYSNLEERIRYGAPCDRLIRLKGEEKILDKIEENELDGAFFIQLPEKEVSVGSTWTLDKGQSVSGIDVNAKMTYTVTSISKKSVDVSFTGTVESTEVTGSYNGTANIDPKTGLITASTTKSNLSMTINEQGMSIPVTIVGTTTVEVK